MNYFNLYSSYPDQTVVAAWDFQVKEAGETPWLEEVLRRRGSEFFPRFAVYYAELRALPRSARRGLQRQIAHSSELLATFPERLSRKEGWPLQRKLARSLAGAALLLALGQGVAQSETINVTTKDPRIKADGQCSLIEAIMNANADAALFPDCPPGGGADTIVLPAKANVKLTYATNDSYGPTGLPLITSPMTIEGNGAKITRTYTYGAVPFRLITVSNSGDLTLQNVNLSGGSSGSGGGVSNYGTLFIESSIVSGNTANSGGGVSNGGTRKVIASATLKNSNKTGPYCYTYYYGEVCYYHYSYSGNLTIHNSTISKNSAQLGGGVVNNSGDVIIQDSTISKNSAEGFSYFGTYYEGVGGGISNHGSVTVTGSTISANRAHMGGGVFNNATLTLNRSLISGSTASVGPEIADYGTVTSDNFNLFGTNGDAGVAGFVPGLTDIVPGRGVRVGNILGPLKNNGGPTQTHALKRGSPAVDAISFSDPGCTGTDQRGVARPQGVDCDIGAFER